MSLIFKQGDTENITIKILKSSIVSAGLPVLTVTELYSLIFVLKRKASDVIPIIQKTLAEGIELTEDIDYYYVQIILTSADTNNTEVQADITDINNNSAKYIMGLQATWEGTPNIVKEFPIIEKCVIKKQTIF